MKALRTLGLLALLILVLVFPVLISPNNVVTDMAVFTLIYAMAATGWNIFSGYTGYISIGHAVYFGVGAYTLALICQYWNIPGGYLPFLLLPLVGLVAGTFAMIGIATLALLVAPRDPHSMGEAIVHLISNKPRAQQMAANAYAVAVRRFSPDARVRTLVGTYQQLWENGRKMNAAGSSGVIAK